MLTGVTDPKVLSPHGLPVLLHEGQNTIKETQNLLLCAGYLCHEDSALTR